MLKQWVTFVLLAGLALAPFGIGDFGGINGGPDSFGAMALWILGVLCFLGVFQWLARLMGAGGIAGVGLARHPGWGRNFAVGFGYGLLCIAVAIGAKIGLGQYQVSPLSWPQGLAALLPVLVGTWFTAISEELVFRGYLVKILAHRSLVVIAVVTSLGFVALHLPHWGSPVPYWTSLFFKGLFYAIPVLISRSLWFSVGHHWAWNCGYFLVFGGVPAWHAQEVAGYPLSADYVCLGVSVLMALSAPFVARLLRVNQNPRRVSTI